MKIVRNLLLAFFVVASLAYLTIIIPKPQQTEARTFLDEHPEYNGAQLWNHCGPGNLKIGVSESPSCQNGVSDSITNYKGNVDMSVDNIGNYEYKIDWKWTSYYCENPNSPGCNQNPQSTGDSQIISGSQHAYVSTVEQTRTCGVVQNDFGFNAYYRVKGSNSGWTLGCNRGDFDNLAGTNATFTWCNTNKTCQHPTPTPTATPTPTPTITPPPPHLIVIKEVHNNHGGTKVSNDFMIHVNGNNPSPADFPGHDSPFSVSIGEGQYNVTETQLPGYTLTSAEGCSGTIHNGETITCALTNEDVPASLTVIKVVNNNHGGTKQPGDFVLRVNGAQVINNISYAVNPGDFTISEDDMAGYHQVSNSCGDGHIHINAGENRVCIIMNEDNGSSACTMPTCNTNISGCSYPFPDTKTCSCGPLVCVTQTPSQPNITINVSQQQQQQQQQQAVLGAQVGPAVTAKKLPATGADAEIFFTLLGLLPVGLKLRKFV